MEKVAKKQPKKPQPTKQKKKLFEVLETDQDQADAGGNSTLEKENCLLLQSFIVYFLEGTLQATEHWRIRTGKVPL